MAWEWGSATYTDGYVGTGNEVRSNPNIGKESPLIPTLRSEKLCRFFNWYKLWDQKNFADISTEYFSQNIGKVFLISTLFPVYAGTQYHMPWLRYRGETNISQLTWKQVSAKKFLRSCCRTASRNLLKGIMCALRAVLARGEENQDCTSPSLWCPPQCSYLNNPIRWIKFPLSRLGSGPTIFGSFHHLWMQLLNKNCVPNM